jgi:TatD DNase family protein
MSFYVDIHTHLTHRDFALDWKEVIQRAQTAGVGVILVNGLDPASNRQILEMAKDHREIRVALGIYPTYAVNRDFDLKEAVQFIRDQAKAGLLHAVGECGLDTHLVDESTLPAQEALLEELAQIALDWDLPLVVHTRKQEKRALEMMAALKVPKVNFHCFCGKMELALKAIENQKDWTFSIPANAVRDSFFQKWLKIFPPDHILTETDAPYLSPERGTRNEPSNVVHTVRLLAELRGWTVEEAKEKVWSNYKRLFEKDFKK